jgi:hypothetical protein
LPPPTLPGWRLKTIAPQDVVGPTRISRRHARTIGVQDRGGPENLVRACMVVSSKKSFSTRGMLADE